jgi:hypothetical protein
MDRVSPTGSIESRLQLGLGLSLALLIAGAWWLGHEALHHFGQSGTGGRPVLEHAHTVPQRRLLNYVLST